MSTTRTRSISLVALAGIMAIAILAPRLGSAQDATPAADQAASTELIATGQEIYETLCVACHRPGGVGAEGSAGVAGIPALANNPFVALENPRPLVQTLLTGRAGMPAFRGFSDEEIAGVASYIRQDFGNQAGPVDPALVAEVRAEFTIPPPPDATPVASPAVGQDATPGADDGSGEAEAVPTPGQ
jgi:mono/diheme cytochrome c family protein